MAMQAQSAALDRSIQTMERAGLTVPMPAPVEASTPTRRSASAGAIPSVDRTAMPTKLTDMEEHRTNPYKRWTDQDHDELVRQTERMRSMDDTLKQVFGGIADLRTETRASIEQIANRLKLVEDRNTRQEGAETALLQSAKNAAHTRALQVSVIVAVAVALLNQVVPLLVKAFEH